MDSTDNKSVESNNQSDPKLNLEGYFSNSSNKNEDEDMNLPLCLQRVDENEENKFSKSKCVEFSIKSPFRKKKDDKEDYSVMTKAENKNKNRKRYASFLQKK